MAEPPGDHPAITAWLAQRITRLWNEKRARESVRIASAKATAPPWNRLRGPLARASSRRVSDRQQMSCLLERVLPAGKARARARQSHLAWLRDRNLHGSCRARSFARRSARAAPSFSKATPAVAEIWKTRDSIGRLKRASIAPGSASRRPSICAAPASLTSWRSIPRNM